MGACLSGIPFMKYSQYDIQQLHAQSKGMRSLFLFVVLALIIAAAAYSAVRYQKVKVEVEPEVPKKTRPARSR